MDGDTVFATDDTTVRTGDCKGFINECTRSRGFAAVRTFMEIYEQDPTNSVSLIEVVMEIGQKFTLLHEVVDEY